MYYPSFILYNFYYVWLHFIASSCIILVLIDLCKFPINITNKLTQCYYPSISISYITIINHRYNNITELSKLIVMRVCCRAGTIYYYLKL